MSPLAYCQQKTATSGSSFLAGFRFLSPQKKDAITVLYAFCRELDDVVDELDCRKEVEYAREIVKMGTGADRKIKVYNETGDLKKVVDYMISETEFGLF